MPSEINQLSDDAGRVAPELYAIMAAHCSKLLSSWSAELRFTLNINTILYGAVSPTKSDLLEQRSTFQNSLKIQL
jgi:hypothetical protein